MGANHGLMSEIHLVKLPATCQLQTLKISEAFSFFKEAPSLVGPVITRISIIGV